MATESSTFVSTLTDSPHEFLQPSLPLYTDALAYLKLFLDPLASQVAEIQQERQQQARKKRKRGEHISDDDVLRLKRVHTEGFGVNQIWEQARRVLDAAVDEAERVVVEAEQENRGYDSSLGQNGVNGYDEESDDESLGEEGVNYEIEGVDEDIESDEEEGDDDEEEDEDAIGEDYDLNDDDLELEDDERNDEPQAEEFVADKFGLNDGFFSIDNFNRQSEFLEQQDVRGEDDGAASDEEDIDWDVNPVLASGTVGDTAEDSSEDEDEGDGPTFGDPDAPSEDEDDEGLGAGDLDDMGGMANTNNVMYAEFFAPPAQKKKKNKKGRPNPHNFPAAAAAQNGANEDEMERTMAAVHRDLFDDESEEEEEEGQEGLDPGDPRSRKSAHERRQAALAEEIRKLEAANVAKREWTLSGEARAADRPLNSLLEEDLDFERTGKPVPVITAEVSENIEELIKRRILAHEFEDIIRRRPDDLATGKDGRRGRLDYELDNEKSKKGLAEEYEEEHLRRTDPNFVDAKDEKLKKEEKEIEALWKKICNDLDSLSSWHFRPKQAAPQLDIRVDAPVISMEDARPSAGGEVAGASQLAPQEVYKGGEAAKRMREEVVGKSGLPAGREEMSREDRKRRRRREKERIRKASGSADPKAKLTRGADKNEMIGNLKKANVKVITNKGQVQNVDGKDVREDTGRPQLGAGQYKL